MVLIVGERLDRRAVDGGIDSGREGRFCGKV